MKCLLKKIFLFIFIVLLIFLGIDIIISKKIFPYNSVQWYNLTENIQYDGIIYGSSRAYMHLNPYILQDSTNIDFFNYGVVAGRINSIYLKHKAIFKNDKITPKYVLISLDPFLFCINQQIQNKKDFLPILLFNLNAYNILQSDELSLADVLIPYYRYMGYKETIYTSTKEYIRKEHRYDKGFFNPLSYNSSGWTPNDEKYREELASISKYPTEEIKKKGISYFREIIEDCQNNNIQVVFVYSPIYKEATSVIDTKTLQYHDSVFSSISKEYNIPFLNYKNDARFNDDYHNFVDFTHLTSSNATRFTNIVADTLNVILR